jgi:adenosylcobinamide-GDP ribazoletransferase
MAASAIWSGAVPAALAICAGVVLTGALHEDGIADTSDGLFGGRSREQRLMIIKDSRIGTYGATALCLSLILRVAVLASIPPSVAPAALIAGHCAGRMAIVLVMSVLPYGGNVDAARLLYPESRIDAGAMVVAVAFTALGLSWLVFANVWAAVCGLAGAALCGLFPPRLARRLLGGYTGDILGATQQMAEIGLLLGVAAIAAHGHL